ncbi:hypothetical protein MSG28_010015 [Choristoneura fumiferana]|uniref:Uncharacterized protein n=1 Tax=Choristoneura fumiferana TaxID=7141 RepID=A0ACC0KJX0_CHOFU|nr:hypothetical protein MSG28_010015 [Choristoneura fumiferana]
MATKTLILGIVFISVNFNLILCKKEIYEGTSFPKKYFLAETLVPTSEDLESYLLSTKKIVNAISLYPNLTDPNRALGVFYMKSILRRTILENGKKLNDSHIAQIKEIIKEGERILGYYFHYLLGKPWTKPFRRVIELFRDDTVQVESISNFTRNRLAKWLVNPKTVNSFAKQFDEITLSKEKYASLVQSVHKDAYVVSIDTSDNCMSMIVYNRIYFDKYERLCTADKSCADILYKSPSVAYSLSHRATALSQLWCDDRIVFSKREKLEVRRRNVDVAYDAFNRHNDWTQLNAPAADDKLIEALCASMYRETVYLARRGYFYRDLFLEHIALCGLVGFREFFRHHWFRKIISWVDSDGCIQENMNFEHLRTKLSLEKAKTEKKKDKIKQGFREMFHENCSYHQMALSLMVLAHGEHATRRLPQHAHYAPPLCSRDCPTKLTPAHNYPHNLDNSRLKSSLARLVSD